MSVEVGRFPPTAMILELPECHRCRSLHLDALHAAVRLRPPQQAEEGLGLGSLERDHVPALVRDPGRSYNSGLAYRRSKT